MPEGWEVGRQVKKVKGIKWYKLPVTKLLSHTEVTNSIEKIVNNTIVTWYGDRR